MTRRRVEGHLFPLKVHVHYCTAKTVEDIQNQRIHHSSLNRVIQVSSTFGPLTGRQPCVALQLRSSGFTLRRRDPREKTGILPLFLHLLLPGCVFCSGGLFDPDRIPPHEEAAEREERGADDDLCMN